MTSTGIVRQIDALGRLVLPIELRRTLQLEEKDSLYWCYITFVRHWKLIVIIFYMETINKSIG